MEQKRKFGAKEYFVFIISIVILTDLAILLNIPFLRQILGFLFLTILPGLLIIQVLKLSKLGFTEKFVLSVGISISFLMFFGLLINNLSLSIGYETPLSTISLLISFNLAFIVLAIVGHKINKTQTFSLPNLNLTTPEKAFLVVPVIFPTLSIFGMHVMNTTDNNIILMFLLVLIPIYVVFISFFNHKFPKRLYPVVIFSISISLLLLLSLRSNHILGADTHSEFYLFQITLDNLHWSVFGRGALDACLNISLLPTIYHSILNIPSEFLFKILHSLLYSISPLVIYVLSKKYIGELYGFLASCFFMFQANFLWTAANSRTSIAILFFALAMMVFFNDKIEPLKKRILFIVFMASCMVSHYSTTYIFFFILLGAFVGIEILSGKYSFKKIVSLTIVILFFSMIFFWYSQVTETAFNAGVSFVEDTFSNLNRFFIEESRTEAFKPLVGQELEYPILSRINFVLTWSTFILIGIGVLTLIKKYREMIALSNVKVKKPDFLKTKFEMEYLVMTLTCAGLLVIMVALPFISIGYDIWRLYSLVIVILSVCFVIGGMTLAKHFFFLQKTLLLRKSLYGKNASQKTCAKRKSCFFGKAFFSKERFDGEKGSEVWTYLIILLILIPYFLFYSGAVHQLCGIHDSIILNSEGKVYDVNYVHDQESCGAKWLAMNGEKNSRIYTTDGNGWHSLISQGKISSGQIDCYSFPRHEKIKGYLYLSYNNIIKNTVVVGRKACNMSVYSDTFVGMSKIYSNGCSETWK